MVTERSRSHQHRDKSYLRKMMYWFLFITIFTFGSFGVDKWLAVHHKRRISEITLLTFSFLGGVIGALLAMMLFRHKISKRSFILKMALVFFLQMLILGVFWGYKKGLL